jgi:hypothetical protein
MGDIIARKLGVPERAPLVCVAEVGHALWDIHQSLGNVKADTILLKGQIDFSGTTMTDLAQRTVAAAKSLYGNGAALEVSAAFEERGIL